MQVNVQLRCASCAVEAYGCSMKRDTGLERVVMVCASECNRRGMARPGVRRVCEAVFHDYDDRFHRALLDGERPTAATYDPELLLDEVVRLAETAGARGLTVTQDYPGALVTAAAAERLELPGPTVDSILACQHKYLARRLQRAAVPEATPRFALLGRRCRPPLKMPLFAKPIRANFSFGARRVDSFAELAVHRRRLALPEGYLHPLRWALSRSSHQVDGDPRDLLLEELLQGQQVTLEGIAADGEIHLVGVVDSLFFPGTVAFERFRYPSTLPADIQARMLDISSRFIRAIGFDGGLFNVEFLADAETGTVRIVEVNPRMCSQFADMMEKVDGVNTYEHAARVALGRPPRLRRRRGRYRVAASFPLRVFEDCRATRVPTPAEVERLERTVPGVEAYVWVEAGQCLSSLLQDEQSFSYGRLNIGARDEQELEEKRGACLRLLPFAFEPVATLEGRRRSRQPEQRPAAREARRSL
jgi:biotin carboxylase